MHSFVVVETQYLRLADAFSHGIIKDAVYHVLTITKILNVFFGNEAFSIVVL